MCSCLIRNARELARPIAGTVVFLSATCIVACGDSASSSNGPGSTGGGTMTGVGAASTSGGTSGNASDGGAGGSATGGAGAGGNSGVAGVASMGGVAGVGGGAGGANGGNAGSSNGGAAGSTTGGTGGDLGVASDGCGGQSPPTTGRYEIDVSGTQREYILKLPEGYDDNRAYPLIFAWHGGQYDADWVDSGGPPQTGPYFGIESEASGNAIFVAPEALASSWTDQDGRDIAFVDAMVSHFLTALCIDESRIFSTGFSFGGRMTITIGCARADVFRAIAPMSGTLDSGCADADQPVAYWSSHGDMDPAISISQGEAARNEFLSRNGCAMTTTMTEPAGCVSYQGCEVSYPVTWCPFPSDAHEPPEFAGSAIWSFFTQF